MDPFSGQLIGRAAKAVTPDSAARVAREVVKWVVNAVKGSLQAALKAMWRTFWTGGIVSAIVILVVVVIAAQLLIGQLGLSSADSSGAITMVGGVLFVALLLRLLMYMVLGGRSDGRR
jgi:fumarate reductase subunit D